MPAGKSPPKTWIHSDDPAKDPREVRLITHPAIEGDLRQRRSRAQHDGLRVPDTLPHNVSEWRFTETLAESPDEMSGAQSCDASKVSYPDGGADVGRNVRGNVPVLPWGKAAWNSRCSLDRVSLAGHSQQFCGALNAGFCRDLITLQCCGRH